MKRIYGCLFPGLAMEISRLAVIQRKKVKPAKTTKKIWIESGSESLGSPNQVSRRLLYLLGAIYLYNDHANHLATIQPSIYLISPTYLERKK